MSKANVLTNDFIMKVIETFETREKKILQSRYQYYQGKQQIMNKPKPIEDTKPYNRIVTNYCKSIVANYVGYMTGKPISYTSELNICDVWGVLRYNDCKKADGKLLKNALIYGVAYEVAYVDENGKQRFKTVESTECIPVYDNTIGENLMYLIRYYPVNTLNCQREYVIEVYDKELIWKFRGKAAGGDITLEEVVKHYYGQVPVTVLYLNDEHESIFEQIITLQDAYNNLLSSEVDDFQSFCDAFMVMRGVNATSDDIAQMKKDRVILLDDENAGVEYLTKSVTDTQIENMLTTINDNIHKIANSPDFGDETFMSTSGIAMRFKLLGFENTAGEIENNLKEALQKRIELICSMLKLTNEEMVWRDIEITVLRNMPIDDLGSAQIVNLLRGIVSDKTLLSQLPFITDIEKELNAMAAQKEESMAMYQFTGGEEIEP